MTALPQQTQQQIYQQIPAHLAALAPNGHHAHSIYQPLVAVSQGSIYVSNMATLRRPQIPAHQQLQQQAPPPAAHAHALQMKSPQSVAHEAPPASTTAESLLYERDKQIYKCSTLRQGGKFDAKYKPSILNCPLPEIPKDAQAPKVESIYQKQQQHSFSSKTLQRPPMKILPQMKAIPPPRIGNANITATNAATTTTGMANNHNNVQTASQMHNGTMNMAATTTATSSVSAANEQLPPPPPVTEAKTSNILNNNNNHNNNNSSNNHNNNSNNNNDVGNTGGIGLHNGSSGNGRVMNMEDDDDLPPPPPPAINDESNYAVTEL